MKNELVLSLKDLKDLLADTLMFLIVIPYRILERVFDKDYLKKIPSNILCTFLIQYFPIQQSHSLCPLLYNNIIDHNFHLTIKKNSTKIFDFTYKLNKSLFLTFVLQIIKMKTVDKNVME